MSRRNSTTSKPSESSPNIDDVVEQPLDAFTQELVRENELLIADLDNLRENEDRLIAQIQQLQHQLSLAESNKSHELSSQQVLLEQKDQELETLTKKHEAQLHSLKEELIATQHTLSMYEESSRQHDEQMETLEAELEEAKSEIQRLQAVAEEKLDVIKEDSAKGMSTTETAANNAVTSSLSEISVHAKLLQATVQSIHKSVRGNVLFSTYGDPLAPFESQPTPSLTLTERDVELKEAEIAKFHQKIVETIRRIESYVTMADDRCKELGMPPESHPFRVFVSTCVDGCSLLVTLFVGMSKIGLISAKKRYSFTDGMSGTTGSTVPKTNGGQGGDAVTVASQAPSTTQAEKPSTSRGLGLWVR